MSNANIRKALVTAFQAGAYVPTDKVHYENQEFTPPKVGLWAKVTYVPSESSVATLGTGGRDEQRGFLQVDLNCATGIGEADIVTQFEAMKLAFTAGTKFSYSGQVVTILSCSRSQGRIVNGYYRVSITIQFYAQIAR